MIPRRALVTGAAGFIGAALAHRLVEGGCETTLLTSPTTDAWRLEDLRGHAHVLPVDLRDAGVVGAAVQAARPDVVFHLAAHGAYSWQQDLRRMIETNITGLANVAEAVAVTAGTTTIVNAGSSSEYGLKDHAPVETELPAPNSAYSFTKASATLLCDWIARDRGLAITTLRLYSAYGPWEEPRRLIPAVVLHGLDGRLPPLVDPRTARDFVHVDDVVDAFLVAGQQAAPGHARVYNVGSGTQTTLRELADVAREVFGIDESPAWGSFPARAWDTDVWVADARRIRADLGWTARTTLANGLRATAAWFEHDPARVARYRDAILASA